VQRVAGLGLALVAAPALVALDPRYVPVPLLVGGFFVVVGQAWAERRHVPREMLAPALAGLVLGTAIGLVLPLLAPALASRRAIGVVILLAVALSVATPRLPPTRGVLFAAATGSGAMGALGGVHGPLMALAISHLPAPAFRALLGLFFSAGFLAVLPGAILVGRFGATELWLALGLLPGIALGVLAARPLRRFVHGPRLRPVVLGISGASGVALLLAG
jgi:uncharacterized membrane protein YfcA